MKKKLIVVAAVVVVLVVVALVVGAASLGSIIKKGVETVGPPLTKTEVKLDGASLSLLSGSGALKGFLLGNPEGFKTPSAIKAGSVSIGVKPRSLFAEKVHVTHVRIVEPEITFEGALGTKNNLSKILENVEAATGGDKPAEGGASKKIQVDEFTLTGARVNLSMTMLAGRAIPATLPDIQFKDLGTGPDGITAAELTKKLLAAVTAATLKAVEKAVMDIGKGATDALKDAALGTNSPIKDVTKGVGDLFRRKDK